MSHRDLLENPIPVTLATVGPTSPPQLTAVWVMLDDDLIITSLARVRQKLKNLEVQPPATVFVIDPSNPIKTLEVRCDVTITPDPDLEVLKRLLTVYGTALASFQAPLEARIAVELRPIHVVAIG